MKMPTLLLLTAAPTNRLAWHALELAKALKARQQQLSVFFYQDAVHVANQLNWHPADDRSLSNEWLSLGIDLPVCVSAALYRGITDQDNATRHQLPTANLITGFRLTGLGELADAMLHTQRIIQL
jgi:tRNA 2-thiouridine synthesizing protein D